MIEKIGGGVHWQCRGGIMPDRDGKCPRFTVTDKKSRTPAPRARDHRENARQEDRTGNRQETCADVL
jgi:hypothetical protein